MFGNKVFGGLPPEADTSNPYSILGIPSSASDRQIERAVARAEKRHKGQPLVQLLSNPEELLIARAKLALSDPALRREYDKFGAFDEDDYASWLARAVVEDRLGAERSSPLAPLKTSLRRRAQGSSDTYSLGGMPVAPIESWVSLSPRELVLCQVRREAAKIPESVLSLPHDEVSDYSGCAAEGLTVRYACSALERFGPVDVELNLYSRGQAADDEYLQLFNFPSPPAEFLALMEKRLRGA